MYVRGRSEIYLFSCAVSESRHWLYNKKRPGLFAQGENIFRGTTCFQSLALHFVSTDILCSCNVEPTLTLTGHIKIAVGATARGLLLHLVHESSHRPLSLWISRRCILLPVTAFDIWLLFIGNYYTVELWLLSTRF